MSNFSVSILINNFNYARFLSEAIDSALEQTYPADAVQVVVVDDGSTDGSIDVINSYKGRITTVLKQNGGQGSAMNAGFEACEGDIVCMLDADDYFFPDKVTQVVKAFCDNKSAGWHFHELTEVKEGRSIVNQSSSICNDNKLIDYRPSIKNGGKMPVLPPTSGLSFRRSTLGAILPMPLTFRTCADAFLRLAAMSDAPGLRSFQELAVHRIHGTNLFEYSKDVDAISMEMDIRLSEAMRKHRPVVKPFTDRLFARAIGRLIAQKGWRYTFDLPETSSYLQSINFPQSKINCGIRATVNWARCSLQGLA